MDPVAICCVASSHNSVRNQSSAIMPISSEDTLSFFMSPPRYIGTYPFVAYFWVSATSQILKKRAAPANKPGGLTRYKIHYNGWRSNHDEWVTPRRLQKATAENRAKARAEIGQWPQDAGITAAGSQ